MPVRGNGLFDDLPFNEDALNYWAELNGITPDRATIQEVNEIPSDDGQRINVSATVRLNHPIEYVPLNMNVSSADTVSRPPYMQWPSVFINGSRVDVEWPEDLPSHINLDSLRAEARDVLQPFFGEMMNETTLARVQVKINSIYERHFYQRTRWSNVAPDITPAQAQALSDQLSARGVTHFNGLERVDPVNPLSDFGSPETMIMSERALADLGRALGVNESQDRKTVVHWCRNLTNVHYTINDQYFFKIIEHDWNRNERYTNITIRVVQRDSNRYSDVAMSFGSDRMYAKSTFIREMTEYVESLNPPTLRYVNSREQYDVPRVYRDSLINDSARRLSQSLETDLYRPLFDNNVNIQVAEGQAVDRIGEQFDMYRRDLETDAEFRARILGSVSDPVPSLPPVSPYNYTVTAQIDRRPTRTHPLLKNSRVKGVVNTSAGSLKVITLAEFLRNVPKKVTAPNEHYVNIATLDRGTDSVNQREYYLKNVNTDGRLFVESMFEEIEKQFPDFGFFEGYEQEHIHEAAANSAMEMGTPSCLVRLAPRIWMVANPQDFVLYQGIANTDNVPNKAMLVCVNPNKVVINEVGVKLPESVFV